MKSAKEEIPQSILPRQRLFLMKQEQAVRSQEMPHIHIAGCLPFFRRRRRGLNSSGSESTPPSNSQVDHFFWISPCSGLDLIQFPELQLLAWQIATKGGGPLNEVRQPQKVATTPRTTPPDNQPLPSPQIPPKPPLYLSEFETNMVQHSPKEAMDRNLDSSEASWRLLSVAPCTLLTTVCVPSRYAGILTTHLLQRTNILSLHLHAGSVCYK